MFGAKETSDREQLAAAYRNPVQLDSRRGMSEYKYPKFNLQDEVLKAVDLKNGESLLEVGCGKGDLINSFPDNGENLVLGSDLFPGMMKESVIKSRRFLVSDSQNIPFRTETFDAVAAVNMLYHVPDKDAALSEMARVLKSNGRVVITGHSITDRDLSRRLREATALQFGVPDYPHPPMKFNTENGSNLLGKYFSQVDLKLYPATITVPEITPHLVFFDSMRFFWNQKFTDGQWQDILQFAKTFLDAELQAKGIIQEKSISGIFVCKK